MKIGYSMYSARELCQDQKGMEEVLREIARMGYDGVEFYQYADMPADKLKRILEECRLEAIATHVHKPRWDADTEAEIAYAVEVGIPRLVYPWIEPELRTKEFYQQFPHLLKILSEKCGQNGIALQYHNHDFEFEKLEDSTVMDFLLDAESGCSFELDTFWAYFAGVDVVEYMKKHNDRIPMIHVKDYAGVKDGEPQFCAIGTGILNNTAVLRCAEELEKEWAIVELDSSPLTPLESARISLETIRKIIDKGVNK